jgi:ABC-type Fe3+-hydroxamate transport system substrate-binding protein
MPLHTDQLGRTVETVTTPGRIISVVPSQTELLYHLGLNEEVTAITKFCIHPAAWHETKPKIGGTKNLQVKKIKDLQPQLIIANKEENTKEQIEELSRDFPVWISDINNIEDALEMIGALGEITGKQKESGQLVKDIRTNFSTFHSSFPLYSYPQIQARVKTAYLIWMNPFMTVGGDTFIHNMMQYAGLANIFAGHKRYPRITLADLQTADCELLILSSEPYPFKQKHIDELKSQLPHTKIILADGEMFSWYGSRLLKAPAYFEKLQQQIHRLS